MVSNCRHRQSSYNSCARYERRSVTVTFSDPTVINNLIVVEAIVGGGRAAFQQIEELIMSLDNMSQLGGTRFDELVP